LMSDVMDGHDVGMAKKGRIDYMKEQAQRMLDSIAKLPAKAQEAAAPMKAKLEKTLDNLKSSWEGMEKWMTEFDMDSAKNNLQERIHYLTEEKLKVSKVKEDILTSLRRADSVVKSKL